MVYEKSAKVYVLGLAFSARRKGNCSKLLEYCLKKFEEMGFETELMESYDLNITPCSHCNYECFSGEACPVEDDVPKIYEQCKSADIILFAVPTYGGHVASLYLAFSERGQAIFESYKEWKEFAKKVNFIIIGNLSSGGDMALHEALYSFANFGFWPEVVLISSREYGRSSIKGDLIEEEEVKKRLDRFVERINQKMKENN
ncbi:hypothetical protein PAP_07510 [Palaeococcus pacificus DY20341]|uniref:NADPH-dependent FMN reductase-like domain-containing protein n=1 Tax=Palaeococcus pacificus DY20341 TaxID=1343739 RepID=A0A075LV74_9EURY|nr:flavodoxin family protein [Palaeococcus pacificus]AIF69892.1 hypothetical protein PAP_07510 [Palaeococcus pacificus DY20341]